MISGLRYAALIPIILLVLAIPNSFAQDARALSARRISTLPAGQQAAWTAYFQKSQRQMQFDKETFASELKAAGLKEPIPAPGGSYFPREAGRTKGWYGTPEAMAIADNIVSFQTPSGGWCKHVTMSKAARQPGQCYQNDNNWRYVGTFDNGATYSHMLFLARAYKASGREAHKKAFLRGVEYMLMAQYPNGGWPEVYPLMGGYMDNITFNDGAMINVMTILKQVADGEYEFVPAETRAQAKAAFEHGIDCILACQIKVGRVPTVWCSQHDAQTLAPAKARAYELPSLSGGESSGIVQFLMSLDKPSPAVMKAVHDAAAWYERSKLTGIRQERQNGNKVIVKDPNAPPLWARFYDLETNCPFFCGRDGVKKWDIAEIEAERRNGYGWYGTSGSDVLAEYAKWKTKMAEGK